MAAAGEEAGGAAAADELEKKLVELEKKLVEDRQMIRASPFVMSLTSSANRFGSFVYDVALCIRVNPPAWAHM